MNINQKVVIVTGSGGGIGEGIDKHFAAHGAKVLVNDIQAATGHKVVKEIQAEGGTAMAISASENEAILFYEEISKAMDSAAMPSSRPR